MDLQTLYSKIEQYAMNTQTVESVTFLSPYLVWNSKHISYPCFSANLERVSYTDNTIEYHFQFVYGGKLTNDSSNVFELQNTAFIVIRNVINHLKDEFGMDAIETTDIYPFQQSFSDVLAGGYADVIIYTPMDDLDCEGFDKD